MTIFISISLIIALIIYLKLYNSHPYFLLDKNGVIKKEHRRTFCHSFIHLDPNDFNDLKSIHHSYFPNGSYETRYYSSDGLNNTLFIETSIEFNTYPNGQPCDLVFPVNFVIRKLNDSPETYIMYLSERCGIRDMTLKGDFYKGSLSNLKKHFELWEKKQKEFLKKNHHI